MTPSFHALLVNGRWGDPALFVDFRFDRRALLFDMGDLSALSPRKMLRIDHVFISHRHMDHFIGFDQLLRLAVGREKTVTICGPEGMVDAVEAKLAAYSWNLVDRFAADLQFRVVEAYSETGGRSARFRLKTGFQREETRACEFSDSVIAAADTFRIKIALLDHKIPCIAYALCEKVHVNIWKNRVAELDLPVGSWLRDLKQAVIDERPDDTEIPVYEGSDPDAADRSLPLGFLKDNVLRIIPGQKIAYVVDVAFTPANARKIAALARGADTLFIEAMFARADTQLAADRAHLTTDQAGVLARGAGAQRVEPFHFSPRYSGEEARMLQEVSDAFAEEHRR